MKPYQTFLISLFLSVIVLTSCKGTGKLSYTNISGFYQPDRQFPGLSFALFNLNDSITNLYIRFPMEGLSYLSDNNQRKARFRLSYQLFDGYEKGILVDSASFSGVDSLAQKVSFMDSVAVRAVSGSDYVLSVQLVDQNAGKSFGAFLHLQKQNHSNVHDFLLIDESGLPRMRNYLSRNEKFRIRTTRSADSLMLRYYGQKYPPAVPPFNFPDSDPEQQVDSSFLMPDYADFSGFELPQEGRYALVHGDWQVMVVHRFYDGFPGIGSTYQMRETLRYISSDAEYLEMATAPPRAAIDRFWIQLSGHAERALSQIRRYYGRVEDANRFFSLSREGWKSDRGMIYLVFGPPSLVYRNAASEQWTYGEAGNPLSLRFLFSYEAVPDNQADYILVRSESYRTPWHMAVANWRR